MTKPLLSVICYNRMEDTRQTLVALRQTGAFREAVVVVWDNASTDGTPEMLARMARADEIDPGRLYLGDKNIGCPRALNSILCAWRKPGQHFIKVDNDVVLETSGWVNLMVEFLECHPEIALASAWYPELEHGSQQQRIVADRGDWLETFPVLGHCAVHRGSFLDNTGYFDVLTPDHLYGFEDTLMAHRAAAMGAKGAVVKSVRLRNIQRKNSLDSAGHQGERHSAHVERLRPFYTVRVQRVRAMRGAYWVGSNGQEEG